MPLTAGKYTTRNQRVVELREAYETVKKNQDGSDRAVRVWKGTMFKADGSTPDSDFEWEETNLPNTLGVFVRAGAAQGVSNDFDLSGRIAA